MRQHVSGSLGSEEAVGLFPMHRDLERFLDGFLRQQAARWAAVRPELREGFELLAGFIGRGGKRLRPAMFYWGAMTSGRHMEDEALLRGAGAVEVLHSFALIHDDVMDASDTRRGHPSMHRQLERLHAAQRQQGDAAHYGVGLAILAGDVALVLADVLMEGSAPAVLAAAQATAGRERRLLARYGAPDMTGAEAPEYARSCGRGRSRRRRSASTSSSGAASRRSVRAPCRCRRGMP